jgi:hypothetical protein
LLFYFPGSEDSRITFPCSFVSAYVVCRWHSVVCCCFRVPVGRSLVPLSACAFYLIILPGFLIPSVFSFVVFICLVFIKLSLFRVCACCSFFSPLSRSPFPSVGSGFVFICLVVIKLSLSRFYPFYSYLSCRFRSNHTVTFTYERNGTLFLCSVGSIRTLANRNRVEWREYVKVTTLPFALPFLSSARGGFIKSVCYCVGVVPGWGNVPLFVLLFLAAHAPQLLVFVVLLVIYDRCAPVIVRLLSFCVASVLAPAVVCYCDDLAVMFCQPDLILSVTIVSFRPQFRPLCRGSAPLHWTPYTCLLRF